MRKINPDYFRNIMFGVEDSLVSTVGVLFGVAVSETDYRVLILTGLIVICVEATSMGAGAFLTEQSTHEIDSQNRYSAKPTTSGMLMFLSYFFTGFIPLGPYFFLEPSIAKYVSAAITLVALFIAGYIPNKKPKAGFRMLLIAGLAILFGFFVSIATRYAFDIQV